MTRSYRELTVWQRAMELAEAVYELTEQFPSAEQYGLTSQMRRAAVSIPSNIAEGRHRGTRRDYLQFLRIAFGSGSELETQVELSKRLRHTKHLRYEAVDLLLSEVMRMLNVMIRTMQEKR